MATAPRGVAGQGGSILVVDDNPWMRETALAILRSRGYRAEGAEDGLQALGRLREAEFDVVVSDLRMPRLDGAGLLEEVRRMGRPLPVVIYSASVDGIAEAQLRRAGAFRVLMKGIPLGEFVRSVEEACTASKILPPRSA